MTRLRLSSIRRLRRLAAAHWALVTGVPEQAFEALQDPLLADSALAGSLREKAIDRLCASAALRAGEGRDGSVLRLLSLVERESAERARDWRARLVPEPRPKAPEGGLLSALLADMRSSESNEQGDPASASPKGPEPLSKPARDRSGGFQAARGARPVGAPVRFQMAVDDGGEFLVVAGARISLGHSSAGVADIPVLADIESIHVHFVWAESFHAGPGWEIQPGPKARVTIDGAPVDKAQTLRDGDFVELAPHLAFRFRLPEAASASALLELQRGAEAEGAGRVLLLAGGVAGRVRIGAQRARHIPVAGLEFDVSLSMGGAWPGEHSSEGGPEPASPFLEVACDGGVRLAADAPEDGAEVSRSIPLPLSGRVEVIANARPSRRPPFGIALHTLP